MNAQLQSLLSPVLITPPFDLESATQAARCSEDAWNSHDPRRVALICTDNSEWRHRGEYLTGRDQIRASLASQWSRELDYRLVNALWGFRGNRMALRFQAEWRDAQGHWWRSFGTEVLEFDDRGLIRHREASINDVSILESSRVFLWPAPGPRPADHPGLRDIK